MNEQHPCKQIRVDEDSALANSTDVTNLLVDEFKISMETTGGDAYWLNGKNERHNISIHNMVREYLLIIIIMKTNGDLQQKYQKKFINIKYTVLWETSHLTLHGIVKSRVSMSLENVDMIYTPSHHLLKR